MGGYMECNPLYSHVIDPSWSAFYIIIVDCTKKLIVCVRSVRTKYKGIRDTQIYNHHHAQTAGITTQCKSHHRTSIVYHDTQPDVHHMYTTATQCCAHTLLTDDTYNISPSMHVISTAHQSTAQHSTA